MIGVNGGHQLNIFIFEVGMIQEAPIAGLPPIVSTVSVHPLLVAPSSVRYIDNSRSAVDKTGAGSILKPGGRALRKVMLEGTFGAESRGLGPYIGNGAIRFTRFYKEVVRMGEALTEDEVDDNVDWLNGTPFIKLFLSLYNEENTTFFINWYDFWHDRSFQCLVRSFDHRRSFAQGGAQGLTHYSMTIEEVGPIVVGGLGEAVIGVLMDGLTLWNDINNVLSSYTLDVILDAFTGPIAIAASMLEGTLEAVQAQIDAATALFGSSLPATSTLPAELSSLSATASTLATGLDSIARSIDTSSPGPTAPPTAMDWGSPGGMSADLSRWDMARDMRNAADAARFQTIAGLFFGMSVEEYSTFLASSGDTSRRGPEFGGSIDYVVSEFDTAGAIETRFNVPWSKILAFNGFTPLEALVEGVTLRIPVRRYYGTQGTAALPVVGSHAGADGWGRDLAMEIEADEDGDLLVVSGQDCLSQGVQVLSEELAAGLLESLQVVPETVRDEWLKKKLDRVMLADPRIQSVVSVATEQSDRGISLSVAVQAINGATIRTGAPV